MSFMGTYQNNVDPKARVSIPVKYRDALGERFFVTKGFDSCIDIYTVDEWEKFADKLQKLSVTKRDMRNFVRFIFGNATEVELDKQGRILLPKQLRDYAELEKDVTFVGTSSRAEIWNTEKWEDFNSQLNEESIEEAMDLLGI